MTTRAGNPPHESRFQRTDTSNSLRISPNKDHFSGPHKPTSMTARQWDTPAQTRIPRNDTSNSMLLRNPPSEFPSTAYNRPTFPLGGYTTAMSSRSNAGGEFQNFGKYGPDREKMKNDLAYSNSIAKSNIPGVGILPESGYSGYQSRGKGRRQYHNSFPNLRSDTGSSNFPFYSSYKPIVNRGNEIESTRASTTAMSRAQEVIENLRSNVSKANDLAHDNLEAYRRSPSSWINQGMPATDDQALLDEKTINNQKRQKQESYRDELERQIRQTQIRKAAEKRNAETHPLGAKYDVPGTSHWHQPSSVISPEKAAALAKLVLESKSMASSSRSGLNQSPENARKEAALENLRKARMGPSPFQSNNAASSNNVNYLNSCNDPLNNNNNNFPSPTQSHPGAQAFPTNSSMSSQRPDSSPSNSSMNYNNSSQRNIPTNLGQNQSHQKQYQQIPNGNHPVPTPTPPQAIRDAVVNQYQEPGKQTPVNYPNNNNTMVPMGYGQPVLGQFPNGYGPVPWPNMVQPQPYQQHPGFYAPTGNPYNHPQYPYQQQQQQRVIPPNPAYPNGYFQPQIGRPPVHSKDNNPNVQRAMVGGQVQCQSQEEPYCEVQQQEQPVQHQRQFKTETSLSPDANINRRSQPYSQHESEFPKLDSYFKTPSKNRIAENKSSGEFMSPEEFIDFEKLKDEAFVKQKSWQTSEDRPDPGLKEVVYKAELRQQIEQNKRARLQKLAREAEEEARLEQRIYEYNNKCKRTQAPYANTGKEHRQQIHQSEREEYTKPEFRGFENSETSLAKKLESREHLGDGDRRQRQPFRYMAKEVEPQGTKWGPSRRWSPPIPAVQRQLEYAYETGLAPTRGPTGTKGQPKLGLDLDFMSALQSTISTERERVERSLREKLHTSNGPNSQDGYY